MNKPDFARLRKVLLRLGEPDIVPLYELFADSETICAATGNTKYPENLVEFFYKFGFDCMSMGTGVNYELPMLSCNDTADLAKERRMFADENHGIIETRADFDKYNWPVIDADSVTGVREAADLMPDGMKAIPFLRSVFENLSFLMGLVPLSYAIYDDIDLVSDITERLGNDMIKFLKVCLSELDLKKIGAITLCEDMGYLSGTMVAPEFMRKYIFPWEKKAVELLHDHDIPVILHACGNLEDVMDDLIDYVGFDAKHSFEDKILPVCEAKKKYGNRITLLGGVDMNFLCTANEKELREYAGNIIKCCAPGGGYAFGTGNSVANYIPLENYRIILDEYQKLGRYPII